MIRSSNDRRALLVPALAAVAALFFVVPLIGLLRRASWSTLVSDLLLPDSLSALRLSLTCSLSATALAVLFGLPLEMQIFVLLLLVPQLLTMLLIFGQYFTGCLQKTGQAKQSGLTE